ncbi:MAG: GNAT family N-acetyltransferase [Erysipelotrichaceae bacterium]
MDYHSDRFEDHSLMIYRKDKLYAILPANRVNDILYSHQGLTYGGLITSSKVTAVEILEVFCQINDYLRANGFKKFIYKAMPFIYHINPAQEDLYALFKICNAQLIGRNISSTICQSNKIKFIESRKSGIRKANNNGIKIKESDDFASFWEILDTNLKNKYGILPVHSLAEIELLHSRFSQNIKLYLTYQGNQVLGGTLIYKTRQVIHTQYISASLEGKELGVLDLLFDFLINSEYINYSYFDFGQSTEQMGMILNESLIFQKEGFGGRGMMYDIYEYEVK